jgi:hypothetical protein
VAPAEFTNVLKIGQLERSQELGARNSDDISGGTSACNGRGPDHSSNPQSSTDGCARVVSYIGGTNDAQAAESPNTTSSDIARCFLRLANLDNSAFERANRYQTALWRQVGQVLLTLDFLRRTR